MKIFSALCSLALLIGCSHPEPWAQLTPATRATPELVLVWVGHGECERLKEGAWVRDPTFDYEFSVEQRRFQDHWESIKTMRRVHPDYDGSAGPRVQNYLFQIQYSEASASGEVTAKIASSLGPGEGHTDPEFRRAVLTLTPEVSRFAPFDQYKIEQSYQYEAGLLDETVWLNKGDEPWGRNQEHATLFASHSFDAAPTKR